MPESASKQKIGMIGIGGTGMQGLAYILAQLGHSVFGTDAQYKNIKDKLQASPFKLLNEDEFWKQAHDCDQIIYTDAVKKNSSVLQKAKSLAPIVEKYSDAVGQLSKHYCTIAVAGTHGKSSTTAMLAHILTYANLDPTVLIGAAIPQWGNKHARIGQSKYFLLEADEYRNHFLSLHPKHAIITSIEHDHPDFFQDINDTLESYQQFINQTDKEGRVFAYRNVAEKYPSVQWPANTTFLEEDKTTNFKLTIPGKHMQQNAGLAVALAQELGVKKETAKQALAEFQGLERRFETVGEINKMTVISDYGHHPTEIKVTLKAAKDKYPDEKLLVLFEAHTSERLSRYRDSFTQALSLADKLIIVPPFIPAGRQNEQVAPTNDLSDIKRQLSNKNVETEIITDYDHLKEVLNSNSKQYNRAIYFSAGILDQKIRALIQEK